VLNFGGGDTLTLQNVQKANLSLDDFRLFAFDYDAARYGDFDNNGRADILFQNLDPAQPLAVWQTNSSGALSSVVSLGPVPAGFRIDGTGNFNSTAGDDILLRNPTTLAVLPMNGFTPQPVQVLGGTSPDWHNSGIGDFTGDGQSDLIFRNVNTGEIATWGVANNALSTVPKVLGSTAPQYHIVAVDDFPAITRPTSCSVTTTVTSRSGEWPTTHLWAFPQSWAPLRPASMSLGWAISTATAATTSCSAIMAAISRSGC
jgi:hypothetical protein